MKIQYRDLIDQNFDFPTEEFDYKEDSLNFHGISQMELIERYGTPLKLSYLPKISENIERARTWFGNAIEKHGYAGKYCYCYVSKSSHYLHVLKQALKSAVYLETSSAFDISIMYDLYEKGLIDKRQVILCNGFKTDLYLSKIAQLINDGFDQVIPVLDHFQELKELKAHTDKKIQIGIRIAAEEEPKFDFYTSRLGIRYKNIVPFYKKHVQNDPQVTLTMLHFFINTGINDNAYYWNELKKCLDVFVDLKAICPTLSALNIGGGFPIKNSLSHDYDYQYMADEVVAQLKATCVENNLEEPDIWTEFGSFTVGESGAILFEVLYQKQQNDRERWNMINGSFMTSLPDSWAVKKRFIMLPINRWDSEYERVFLGGITCDSDDYYNSEQHINAIFLPQYDAKKPLYLGFYHTGAYQDALSGVGGIHHCLIPNAKHILLDRDENGALTHEVFQEEQTAQSMLSILGY
jgi:arginine decarboxylase